MINCDPNPNWAPSIKACAESTSYEDYLARMAEVEYKPCRCAASRNENAECVCDYLDEMGR